MLCTYRVEQRRGALQSTARAQAQVGVGKGLAAAAGGGLCAAGRQKHRHRQLKHFGGVLGSTDLDLR